MYIPDWRDVDEDGISTGPLLGVEASTASAEFGPATKTSLLLSYFLINVNNFNKYKPLSISIQTSIRMLLICGILVLIIAATSNN